MNEWMIIVQTIGLVAMALGIGSFQLKQRSNILIVQFFSNFLWAAHFLLLGATTGAALNICATVRSYVFYKYGAKKNRSIWILIGSIIALVVSAMLSWQGWISLIPMIAIIIATIGYWQHDEQMIRRVILISSPLWLVYGVISGSYAGIANESIVIASVLIALWRYRKHPTRTARIRDIA